MINLLTSDAPRILSSLTHTNLMCRTWFVSVHSRNSKLATRLGFTHTPSFIFAAVSLSPHRPAPRLGKISERARIYDEGFETSVHSAPLRRHVRARHI